MGNDFLAQLRAKQERMKEKVVDPSVPTAKAEPDHGEGDTGTANKLLHKERHPEAALRTHSPQSQPKHGGPASAPAPLHGPGPVHTPAAKSTPAPTQADTKSALSPHPSSSKPLQSPQHSGPPSSDRLPSLGHLPSPSVPPVPLTSPPSSCSSSTSADDVSGHPSVSSQPKSPVVPQHHKGAASDAETEEPSPICHSMDGVPPHIILDAAAEDSVFEVESDTHTSETGPHCSSWHSSTNAAEEKAAAPMRDSAFAQNLSTADSDAQHQLTDQQPEPTSAHSEPPNQETAG